MTRECLAGDVRPFLDEHAAPLVAEYFTAQDGWWPLTGALFETIGGRGDAPGLRDRITPSDLVSVTLLGVKVPGRAALRLLDEQAAEITALLADIPTDVDLWNASTDLVDGDSRAVRLWTVLLGDADGIGWVTAGKLCARKRPRLLPVYDAVVKAALQPHEDMFWLPLREELQDAELRRTLEAIRDDAEIGPDVSLLRVLDVAVWMRNRGILEVPKDRGDVAPLEFRRCPLVGQ